MSVVYEKLDSFLRSLFRSSALAVNFISIVFPDKHPQLQKRALTCSVVLEYSIAYIVWIK